MKVNTRSDANSQTTPTTVGQVVLAKMIETELHELGLVMCIITNKTAFNGTVARNQPAAKSIGLIAHLDTADFQQKTSVPSHH